MSTLHDDNEDGECPGCGSSHEDRLKRSQQHPEDGIPTGLSDCPHCGAKKCCMCDMGDDTDCISCEGA
jgi:hypothetical protein